MFWTLNLLLSPRRCTAVARLRCLDAYPNPSQAHWQLLRSHGLVCSVEEKTLATDSSSGAARGRSSGSSKAPEHQLRQRDPIRGSSHHSHHELYRWVSGVSQLVRPHSAQTWQQCYIDQAIVPESPSSLSTIVMQELSQRHKRKATGNPAKRRAGAV